MAGTIIPDGLIKSGNFQNKTTLAVKPGISEKALSAGTPAAKLLPLPEALTPKEQSLLTKELFREAAASLGFPKDALSVTLFSLLRFFSLTPSQELLGTLRREVLALQKNSSSESAKTTLEAKALALVAALDKGVLLNPEALENYARFLVPPSFETEANPEKGKEKPREETPAPEEIKAIAEEEAQKDELLDFMNTFPGKNRQYWLVFPFKITVGGSEFKVFIRIIKRGENSFFDQPMPGKEGLLKKGQLMEGQLIADISSQKRQWRFFIRQKAGKFRADIQLSPGYSGRRLGILRRKAEGFLGKSSNRPWNFDGFEEIYIHNGEEIAPWTDDLCMEPLPSLNRQI